MPKLSDLKVKIFADGAAKADIVEMAAKPWIAGFTTNPSLLKKAGVKDYEAFARDIVAAVPDRPISFDGGAGAGDRDLGQECLRQAAGHQHQR
jgi:transaldolase